ncbi:ABC transporter ATP-binding protein [Aurantimonas sp. MSK8Z-1]|uniref:dipeptide ABC transporter ATP-binding protein n=1 Tax=Mangrovibrevibacter kandeliae TaxID=2968473 RepID=UPI0021188629|nr:ABC transporter ATP-binding protein [Aurantimonas sp. MSK8Z-1]MCW4115470.1 ABC transporter ATP-binding protein [Aurantimonas sp. MSK8Z-1]
MTVLLALDGLRVEFPSRRGDVVAAKNITLELNAGEILGVVGESGAGKSTIGNAAMGLLERPGRVAGGTVTLEGRRIDNLPPEAMRQLRGARIAMIFQDPLTSLDPLRTIAEQLVTTIRTHLPVGEAEARRRALHLMEQVGIPDPAVRIDHYPHQFSGGMRQRVVIALALCAEPQVIIADEPTTALDVSIQAQILDLLRRLVKDSGAGMIIITHDMGVIAEVADRVAVMYRGDVVETGPTAKILGDPDHAYTRSLISAVPRPDVKLDRFPLVEHIESAGPRRDLDLKTHWLGQRRDYQEVDGPLLAVEGLQMLFRTGSLFGGGRHEVRAVDGVSFDIRKGETFGLVGESGSGKSTIARLITGIYRPTGGAIRFAGTDFTTLRSRTALNRHRRQMQMIFQDPYSSVNPRMIVRDIVAEPIRFHKLAGSEAETRRIVADLLDHVGLGARAALKYPHEFSGGQRQRISIARALATRPRFLICDEPTSALDVSIQAQVLNLLKDLQDELGLTMLFISHDLPVIRQMCDRVAVMRRGQIMEIAETEALFERPQHEYTRHLLDLMPKMVKAGDERRTAAG